jgi:Na+/H+ antiporter NhaD/arsenite permease-like protein
MFASIAIFIIVYFFIVTEKIEKSLSALLGAVAVIGLGLISFKDAMKAIDLNVLFLLIGMMTCVKVLAETGFFEWIAIYLAKKAKGNAILIFISLMLITMIFSAFLDNVTTIILLAPVTILITQILEVPTMPFLILEAIASNIGGTATLIGDPPNIIIGSRVHLSFWDFIYYTTPGILLIALAFILTSAFIFKKNFRVENSVKIKILRSCPKLAIRDMKNMRIALTVLCCIFAGFFIHHHLNLPAGLISLGGMCVILILCKSNTEDMLRAVEWDVILFFIGLFIVIGAMEHNGVIDILADCMLRYSGGSMFIACLIILFGSAIFSSILDNIPFVIAMTPLVQKLMLQYGGTEYGPHPLIWALVFGACLGGNGTLIGASANIIVSKIGKRNGYPITFARFFCYGFPFMIQSLLLAAIYLWFRFF